MTLSLLLFLGCERGSPPKAPPTTPPQAPQTTSQPPALSRFDAQGAGGHVFHNQTLKIDCLTCHPGADDQPRAGSSMRACQQCHTYSRHDHELEALAEQLQETPDGFWPYPGQPVASWPDVSINHSEQDGDCADCHALQADGIMSAEAAGPLMTAPPPAWDTFPLEHDRISPETEALTIPQGTDIDDGRIAYGRYCATCHGLSGQHVGMSAAHCDDHQGIVIPPTPLLGEGGFVKERSDGYLFATIHDGGAIMSAYGGQMTDAEIWATVAWLRHADANPDAVAEALDEDRAAYQACYTPPPPPSTGEEVFTKFGCHACHSTGTDRLVGPPLAGIAGSERPVAGGTVTADDAYLRESILDPAAVVSRDYPPAMPSYKGQLTDEQVEMLVDYMTSL